jgi:hypothetical protein
MGVALLWVLALHRSEGLLILDRGAKIPVSGENVRRDREKEISLLLAESKRSKWAKHQIGTAI